MKDLIQSEVLLTYPQLLPDPQKLEQYRQADYLTDEDKEAQNGAQFREITFMPEGPRGSITVRRSDFNDGGGTFETMDVRLGSGGEPISQFKKVAYDNPDLQEYLKAQAQGTFKLPEGALADWKPSKYDDPKYRQFSGSAISGKRRYLVIGDSSGRFLISSIPYPDFPPNS